MKSGEFIIEMPQIIPRLDGHDTDSIRKFCIKSYRDKVAKSVELLSNTATLYHIGNNDSGIYFSELNGDIGYYAKYTRVQMHPKLVKHEYGVRQILINSYQNMGPAKTGVGKHIFWKHLYPKYNTIISDSKQTENGRSFWEYRIVEALQYRVPVSMVNTNDLTQVEISSIDDIPQLQQGIWGTQNWFQRVVLIIGETK